ncbi:hypothetical protein ScPMuIL_001093, partial [Solemya velum]
MKVILVYKATTPYYPEGDHVKQGYIGMDCGDILHVKAPLPGNCDEYNPDCWLSGQNTTKGTVGKFPGTCVNFVEKLDDDAPPIQDAPAPPEVPHRLIDVYFVKPILCFFCNDYIWGTIKCGKKCDACGKCCHLKCASFTTKNYCSRDRHNNPSPTVDRLVSIENWSVSNVVDWMAALNLYRYAQLFSEKNITGAELLKMDEQKLQDMGIKDDFHQNSILVCIDELCDQSPNNRTYASSGPQPQCIDIMEAACSSEESEHRFTEYNFSSLQRCHLCDKFLYGLMRQGLQCRECGLCCHRYCKATKTTECNVPKLERVRRPSFTQNSVFGTELSEEVLNSQHEVPLVILRCTEEIEKWCHEAPEHSGEALGVYRISVSTESINEVKAAFNVDDPSQVDLSMFPVHCVAGALKKYLRELPNPIIPVENYSHFIECAKNFSEAGTSSEIEEFIQLVELLPSSHKTALQYLMGHFCRLYVIQHESGVSEGIEKLSHVFCHILLRPPWEKIIEIVENTKLHIEIFEELMRSGNWAEMLELPPMPRTKKVEPVPPPPRPSSPRPRTVNSLAMYNRQLDTKLLYPVPRIQTYQGTDEDVNEKKEALKRSNSEYLSRSSHYDSLYDKHSQISQKLQLKHQALDAFKETVIVFEEQMELHQKYHSQVQQREIQ